MVWTKEVKVYKAKNQKYQEKKVGKSVMMTPTLWSYLQKEAANQNISISELTEQTLRKGIGMSSFSVGDAVEVIHAFDSLKLGDAGIVTDVYDGGFVVIFLSNSDRQHFILHEDMLRAFDEGAW